MVNLHVYFFSINESSPYTFIIRIIHIMKCYKDYTLNIFKHTCRENNFDANHSANLCLDFELGLRINFSPFISLCKTSDVLSLARLMAVLVCNIFFRVSWPAGLPQKSQFLYKKKSTLVLGKIVIKVPNSNSA